MGLLPLIGAQVSPPKDNYQVPVVGIRRDTFTLDEGQAVLQWPERLSADSFEYFESWIQLQLKKIKRSIPQTDGSCQ